MIYLTIEKIKFFLKNFIYDNFIQTTNHTNLYNYNDYIEVTRFSKKNQGINNPLRIIKYPVSNKTNFDFNSDVIELFRFRFNEGDSIKQKPTSHSTFLTLKQKRYKRKKVVLPRTIFYKDENGDKTKKYKIFGISLFTSK